MCFPHTKHMKDVWMLQWKGCSSGSAVEAFVRMNCNDKRYISSSHPTPSHPNPIHTPFTDQCFLRFQFNLPSPLAISRRLLLTLRGRMPSSSGSHWIQCLRRSTHGRIRPGFSCEFGARSAPCASYLICEDLLPAEFRLFLRPSSKGIPFWTLGVPKKHQKWSR